MTSSQALLIVNPSSGRERGEEYTELLSGALRRKYGGIAVVHTEGDGDAESAATTAASAGCRRLFVAGGDGTLNEAVNGVATAGALGRVRFGVFPLGTGNDFAAALGIPDDIGQALEVLLEERELPVDVGRVNGRCFLNTSGGGYIAEVSVAVTPQLKSIAGRLAYLIGGAQALLEYQPVRATVSADPGGFRIGLGLQSFAVCNSRLIGGGRLIAPEAVIDDGLLDVCLIEAMGAVEFIGLARKVAGGDHVNDPRVRYLQASSITIDLERETRLNTDGEVLSARRCEYSVLHRAATFVAGDAPFAAGAARRATAS
ncbi:MAG TPA: diacylglycerol kinase family protein [Vicinamibacterales bacterium]|nr:diacylglycerol kinase family protein [Vicinamibacterales bacterium]